MKKFGFLPGGSQQTLTRDQMKLVKGGEGTYAVEGICSFDLTNGESVQIDCNSYSVSDCRSWTEHNMASLCAQRNSTYGGGLSCHS